MKLALEDSAGCCARPAVWLATGAGVGFIPVAPGTFGTLCGLPLAWVTGWIGQTSRELEVLVIVVVCLLGIPICTRAARALGGEKDPGAIVLDEIVSLPITFFLVPMSSVAVIFAGFALHRLFDIAKPPPVRQLERLPDGLGVMADDWAAGVYSCLVLHGLLWLKWLPTGGG